MDINTIEVQNERDVMELMLQSLLRKEEEIRETNYPTLAEKFDELTPPTYSNYKREILQLKMAYVERIQDVGDEPEIKYSDEEVEKMELKKVETHNNQVKIPDTLLRKQLGSQDELSDDEYQELAKRATNVISTLKIPDVMTNRFHILAVFREAYKRVTDPHIQQDIARIYYLFLFSNLSPLDDNDFIVDYFLTQRLSPDGTIAIITKMLGDEQTARESAQFIKQPLDRIEGYLNEPGAIKLRFPPDGGIVYFRSVEVYQPWGMFERMVPRSERIAGISEQDYRFVIDPNCPGLCVKVNEITDNTPITAVERQALRATSTLIHEAIHANGTYTKEIRIPDPGSWEELVLEALTDFGTAELFTKAGLLDRDPNGFPDSFLKLGGYGLLVRGMKTLIQAGLTSSTDEIIDYSLRQDFKGFIELLSQRMEQLSKEEQKDMVNDMEVSLQIDPRRYDYLMELIESGKTLTMQDIFEAIQAYILIVPLALSNPLAILILSRAEKLSPETALMTKEEFFEYLGIEKYGKNTPETSKRRREILIKLFS